MIGYGFIYTVTGAVFAAYALLSLANRANPKRWGNAAFYGLLAVSFLLGELLGDVGNGLLVLGLVAIAGTGAMGRGAPDGVVDDERRTGEAAVRGNWLFAPALIVPATALVGTLLFPHLPGLVDPKQVTLVSLTIGVLLALTVNYVWLRPRATTPFVEGVRLMDAVGWAAVLPQMLASLGAVFALAGVGGVVGNLIGGAIPHGSLIAAVVAYAIGMAGFTIVMGNAFAAFPVMFAAIGMPLLIGQYHGDAAVIAAVGMLAGFCGTLLTPMAANFNLVPAALLDLKDKSAVIRAQVPTALPLLAANAAFLYWMGFP
ncbi:MAG: DUF979 domain-containing protein [Sphingomonas sp.]|uniref:DUF979 domain-containing protein n=1 Tax=Sphingomonas sp. TaxID=28214 RepID=UPI001AD19616|nr:DUF979 domain-containing protein [Sphingomonas sp.]MBN8807953.1 DUF979 domain-containing protein [Sphingomonas sp.]